MVPLTLGGESLGETTGDSSTIGSHIFATIRCGESCVVPEEAAIVVAELPEQGAIFVSELPELSTLICLKASNKRLSSSLSDAVSLSLSFSSGRGSWMSRRVLAEGTGGSLVFW